MIHESDLQKYINSNYYDSMGIGHGCDKILFLPCISENKTQNTYYYQHNNYKKRTVFLTEILKTKKNFPYLIVFRLLFTLFLFGKNGSKHIYLCQ